MNIQHLHVGDTVNVKTWSGMIVVGVVLTLEDDVGRNTPGITFRNIESKENLWCYNTQITGLVRRAFEGQYA